MNKKSKLPVTLSDLLTVIHYTIIKKRGKNEIILKELAEIDAKINNGELENYEVNETTFWKSLINNYNTIGK